MFFFSSLVSNLYKDTNPERGGVTRLEGCQVCVDLTSGPLPLERLAISKLGTLRETQCEKVTLRETFRFFFHSLLNKKMSRFY